MKAEISWKELVPALLALLPILLGFWVSGNLQLFDVGLISIALLIARDRLHLGFYWISLHYVAILVGFSILYFSFPYFGLFVPLVGFMAFASVYFIRHGAQLRTLGNYTFIPALYLSCELRSGLSPLPHPMTICWHFMVLSLIAYLSVIALTAAVGRLFHEKMNPGIAHKEWLPAALSIFFSTGIAAAWVLFFHIQKGEWMIWSAASVITLDLQSAKVKLGQRSFGIFLGVPLGLAIAYFLPKTPLMYAIAMTGVMLSLLAFKRYTLAFMVRCTLIAVAAYVATAAAGIALDRILNVLFGGVIGLICFYVCNHGLRRLRCLKLH